MKTTTTPYIQEEQRRFGAIPRVKAEIRPFDADFDAGLGPGLGTFVNCSCPAAGELLLDSGSVTSASWTSEILMARGGQFTAFIPSCLNLSNYNSSSIYVRSAARYEDVSSETWVKVEWGATGQLDTYFQVKVEFADFIRAWAVDLVGDADDYHRGAASAGLSDCPGIRIGGFNQISPGFIGPGHERLPGAVRGRGPDNLTQDFMD
jgi:hypothetical protein